MGEVFEDCWWGGWSVYLWEDKEEEFGLPVSGVHLSFSAVRGVRTPELGAAGAFVSWASSTAMVVVVVVVFVGGVFLLLWRGWIVSGRI